MPAAETDRNRQIREPLVSHDARTRDQGRPGRLRGLGAIGLRPFREIAHGRSGQNRTHRHLRSATECAFSDRGSGLGLSARRWQRRRTKSKSCSSRSRRTFSTGSMPRSRRAGLRTTRVDVAPMALYNAFRFNYSELTGSSLLIYIGARTTNLIFIEPGKVFSRSIPIGGSSITAAIAKEFNEPFGAAELRKKHDGFVSLGGAYEAEASDPDVARVAKLVRSAMTRLHAELARSISFYRTQQQGSHAGARFPLRRRARARLSCASFFTRNSRHRSSSSIRCAKSRSGEAVATRGDRRLRPYVRRIGRARAAQHHGLPDGVEPATGQCRAPAAPCATSSVPARRPAPVCCSVCSAGLFIFCA